MSRGLKGRGINLLALVAIGVAVGILTLRWVKRVRPSERGGYPEAYGWSVSSNGKVERTWGFVEGFIEGGGYEGGVHLIGHGETKGHRPGGRAYPDMGAQGSS